MSSIVGIDLDALKSQADALRQQLADIDTVIRIAGGMPLHILAPPAMQHRAQAAVDPQGKRKVKNRGARKAILLSLYTGNSSTRDLSKAMVWDHSLVCDVISSCQDAGLVEEVSGGARALTEKGRTIARWFLENPQYVMYTPWRLTFQPKGGAR